MFRTVNQKFYSIVAMLAIIVGIGYAEVAYFLHKQSQTAAEGQRIVQIERQIHNLLSFFFELRYWERAVFAQEYSDAERHFGTLMAKLKIQLEDLTGAPLDSETLRNLRAVAAFLTQYEKDFNKLIQIDTEQRLLITQLDSGYQSLASSVLPT